MGHVARMVQNTYICIGKPEGKRRLGRPKRRSQDNIKRDPKEMGC
jgi:hypothetical protein